MNVVLCNDDPACIAAVPSKIQHSMSCLQWRADGRRINGTAIARIFHGLSSTAYPADQWRKCGFWGRYTAWDFRAIVDMSRGVIHRFFAMHEGQGTEGQTNMDEWSEWQKYILCSYWQLPTSKLRICFPAPQWNNWTSIIVWQAKHWVSFQGSCCLSVVVVSWYSFSCWRASLSLPWGQVRWNYCQINFYAWLLVAKCWCHTSEVQQQTVCARFWLRLYVCCLFLTIWYEAYIGVTQMNQQSGLQAMPAGCWALQTE